MTLLELVKHLRTSILDDLGGYEVQWENLEEDQAGSLQFRWTNEELTSFLNEAQRQACRRLLPLKEEFTVAINDVNGVYSNYVTLDPRIIRVETVELVSTGKVLDPTDKDDLRAVENWRSKEGTVYNYCTNYIDGRMYLYRKPTVDDSLIVYASVLPTADLAWTEYDASPEIRPEHHLALCYGAAAMAYAKDEANAKDPINEAKWQAKFDEEFPIITSAYAETRRRMKNGRGVRYGGL
jgi:hypothetical protein